MQTNEASGVVERVARLVGQFAPTAIEQITPMNIEEVRAAISDREQRRDALRAANSAERLMSMAPLLRDLLYLEVYEATLVIAAAERGQEIELRPGQNLQILEYMMGVRQ